MRHPSELVTASGVKAGNASTVGTDQGESVGAGDQHGLLSSRLFKIMDTLAQKGALKY